MTEFEQCEACERHPGSIKCVEHCLSCAAAVTDGRRGCGYHGYHGLVVLTIEYAPGVTPTLRSFGPYTDETAAHDLADMAARLGIDAWLIDLDRQDDNGRSVGSIEKYRDDDG
jgi:hypothetical protein